MTREEVEQMLGPPHRTSYHSDLGLEWWYNYPEEDAKWKPRVWFDPSGKVAGWYSM